MVCLQVCLVDRICSQSLHVASSLQLEKRCSFCHSRLQVYVTLVQENGEDVAKTLVSDGLVTVEKRKEKRLQKVMDEYNKAQDVARKARVRFTIHFANNLSLDVISIGNSMICSDIWHKYHERYFKVVLLN